MRILIATGIYPPAIGGPAQYAKGVEDAFRKRGDQVTIKTYGKIERILPVVLRHVYFALKSMWVYLRADKVIVLDTFSVAWPIAMLSVVFRKKFIVRTGGDFLWEAYVERTKKKVLFKDFYLSEVTHVHDVSLTRKERWIFRMTQWILSKASAIVFSTQWQREIWNGPYHIDQLEKTRGIKVKIVENFIGNRIPPQVPQGKSFVASTRPLVWKNIDMLQEVFDDKHIVEDGAKINAEKVEHELFLDTIAQSYAVILVSLGDISPNMILDAVRCGKPFICTRECGLYSTLKDIGVWVDPLNKEDIKEKVLWLLNEENYQNQCIRVASFRETHSWDQIAGELISA
ncbi:MAG: hypothetical protein RLY57_158 [Candidatus Parcubacteria bacterium]|jgi:glycosyltransferase involved in cell wall biosynthesis